MTDAPKTKLDDFLKEWHIRLDDDRKLIVHAEHMLKTERVLTGARTLTFADNEGRHIASLQLTGEAQKDWPGWAISMKYAVTVEAVDEATDTADEEPDADV